MAKVSQGVKLKLATLKNNNAKYKLKYTYTIQTSATPNKTTVKYTYSKLITSITKKYSYN